MPNYDAIGKTNERAVVRWFRNNGFPGADRVVRTGAGKAYAHRADEGDIGLAPGVIAQSKRLSPVNRMERAIPGWMAETEAQRVAAGADIALLVVRREGTTDVGEWFAWLPLWQVSAIHGLTRYPLASCPVRFQVANVAQLLRAAGYGEPLDEAAALTTTTAGTP